MATKQPAITVSYDPEANATYICLTGEELPAGRESLPAEAPLGDWSSVVLDLKDGRLVGIEILDARGMLSHDLLAQAD
jgi:uncharacterized protein YuzE